MPNTEIARLFALTLPALSIAAALALIATRRQKQHREESDRRHLAELARRLDCK